MNIRFLVAALLAFLSLSPGMAHAAQATFQVDLSVQAALGNFHSEADLVFVAGDPLNGWSTATSQLEEDPDRPGVWWGTFDIPAEIGANLAYKFVISTPEGVVWEGNVGTGGGTGNRVFTLNSEDEQVPVVFFNNVSEGVSVTASVTFQVDVSVQVEMGTFDPDFGTVSVAGEFNNWSTSASPLERSAADPNLWVATLSLTGVPTLPMSYKFVLDGGTWEGDVGEGGAQNRSWVLGPDPVTLPVVFFNNLASVPVIIPVTFSVNLAVAIARNGFDPDFGVVTVAGDFNGWDTTVAALARGAADGNVWTGTIDVTSTLGSTLLYKFVLDGATWEDGDNRGYVLDTTDPQAIPVAYFSGIGDLGPLAATAGPGVGRLTLSWTAGSRVRLQRCVALTGAVWQDVPGTEGQESAEVDLTSGAAYFRLVGP